MDISLESLVSRAAIPMKLPKFAKPQKPISFSGNNNEEEQTKRHPVNGKGSDTLRPQSSGGRKFASNTFTVTTESKINIS